MSEAFQRNVYSNKVILVADHGATQGNIYHNRSIDNLIRIGKHAYYIEDQSIHSLEFYTLSAYTN